MSSAPILSPTYDALPSRGGSNAGHQTETSPPDLIVQPALSALRQRTLTASEHTPYHSYLLVTFNADYETRLAKLSQPVYLHELAELRGGGSGIACGPRAHALEARNLPALQVSVVCICARRSQLYNLASTSSCGTSLLSHVCVSLWLQTSSPRTTSSW